MAEHDNITPDPHGQKRQPAAAQPVRRADKSPASPRVVEEKKKPAEQEIRRMTDAERIAIRNAASARAEAAWLKLKPHERARINLADVKTKAEELFVGDGMINPSTFTADAIMSGAGANLVQQAVDSEKSTAAEDADRRKLIAAALAATTKKKDIPWYLRGFMDEGRRGSSSSDAEDKNSGSGAKEGYTGYAAPSGEKFGSYKPPKESGWKEQGWQDWSGDSTSKSGAAAWARKYSGADGNTAHPLKEPGQKLNIERVKTFNDIKAAPVVPGNTSPADMTAEEKEAFLNKVYGEDKKPESAAAPAKTPVSKVNGGEGDAIATASPADAPAKIPTAASGHANYSMLNQRSKAGALHREALKSKDPDKTPVVAVTPDAAPAASAEPAKPQANAMLHQRARHSTRPALTS